MRSGGLDKSTTLSGHSVCVRGRQETGGKTRCKRVRTCLPTSSLQLSPEVYPVNVQFIGSELPVPGGVIFSQLGIGGYDRRVLHRLCEESSSLREACSRFNDWWRDSYVDDLGRDKLVGIEKNPGPGCQSDDELGRRNARAAEREQERLAMKRLASSRRAVRNGDLVSRARLADASRRLGEAEGVLDFVRMLESEKAQEEHDAPPEKEDTQPVSVRQFKALGDFTLRSAQGERVEMVFVDSGLSVPDTCKQSVVNCFEGWRASLYSSSGTVEGSVFLNAAFIERMCDRGWGSRTEEAKLSLVGFPADNPYPRPIDAMFQWRPDLVVRILDIICGNGSGLDVDYQEEVSSLWPGENANVITIYRNDLDIRNRAHLLLPVADLPRCVFPINPVELRRAADKRLTSKFNAENWKRAWRKASRRNSFWMRLHGDGSLQDLFGQDRPIERYANDLARRKGLSEKERLALVKVAVGLDTMVADASQHEVLISQLEAALKKMKVFIKDESYEKRNTTLRFIVSPPDIVKLVFGCAFRPVEDFLYGECELLKPHHVKHLQPEDVRARLMDMSASKNQQFYETDYSAYEVCQGRECLLAEYGLYESYYAPGSLARRIISTVAKANVGDTTFLYNKNFRLKVGPMRWSGMPNTACGNLLMNVFNLIYAAGLKPEDQFVCEGDDAMIVADRGFGKRFEQCSCFAVTCDRARHWSELSFCGHAYDSTGSKRVPSDDVMLARLLIYFTRQPLSDQKAYELLYLRFISFQLLYPSWTGFRDFAERCEAVYAGRVEAKVSSRTYREWFRGNWWKMTERLRMFPDFRAIPSPVSGRLFPVISDGLLKAPAVCTGEEDDQRITYDDLVALIHTAPAPSHLPGGPSSISEGKVIHDSWEHSRFVQPCKMVLLKKAWRGLGQTLWNPQVLEILLIIGLVWILAGGLSSAEGLASGNWPDVIMANRACLLYWVSVILAYLGTLLVPPQPEMEIADPFWFTRKPPEYYKVRHRAYPDRAL